MKQQNLKLSVARACAAESKTHEKHLGFSKRLALAKWIERRMLPPGRTLAAEAERDLGFPVRARNVWTCRKIVARLALEALA